MTEEIGDTADPDYILIRDYLDVSFYHKNNPDVKEAGIDPIRHYLEYGAREGRDPSADFSTTRYLAVNADVQAAGANPFVHYLRHGRGEGRPSFRSQHLPIESNIDYFGGDRVTGWARSPAVPSLRLMLQLEVDGSVRGIFCANTPRPDVAAAGKGDGYCGFDIPVSDFVDRGTGTEIRLLVRGTPHVIVAQRLPVDRDRIKARGYAERHRGDWRNSPSLSLAHPLAPLDGASPPSTASKARHLGENDSLIGSAEGVEAYSFDVWDTLLRRDCAPDEVKLQSARFLWLSARDILRPAFDNPRALLRARLAAENASAPEQDFEYRFEDAVMRWLHNVLMPGAADHRIGHLFERIWSHEIEAELSVTRADSEALPLLQMLQKPAVFISDFYHSTQIIQRLLDHHGIGSFFCRGYASSDIFETKRDGRLFDRVARDLAVPIASIVHIGDNEKADVIVPTQLGLRPIHYVDVEELRRREWFEEAYRAWIDGDSRPHQARVAALVDDVAAQSFDNVRPALRAMGARFAPVVFAFVLSVLEDSVRSNGNQINFFTREGQLFQRAYQEIVAGDALGLGQYPPSQLIEISRRATFAASLGDVTVESLMRLWSMYGNQSLRALARSLNLSDEAVMPLCMAVGLEYDETISSPWLDQRVQALLSSKDFRSYALTALTEQRESLIGYLERKGLMEPRSHLVVDIGWRGTIQDNLAYINAKGHFRGHYLGLYRFLNRQPPNSQKSGFAFDYNQGRPLTLSDVGAIEMLCNGQGGSVVGYRQVNGEFEAVREVFPGEEAVVQDEIAAFQRGVIDAMAPLAGYVRRHGLTSETLSELASALLKGAVTEPPREVADAFFNLEHNETFGTGELDNSNAAVPPLPMPGTASSSQINAAGRRILLESRWPEAAVHQSGVTKWWSAASAEERLSLPLQFVTAHSPAILRARGTRCNFFVPSPLRGSGGHRTIYKVISGLARLGMDPTVFIDGRGAGLDVVEDYLGGTRAILHDRWDQSASADLAMATVASSAQFVLETSATLYGYLVQDFEALFNPMSDGYLIGENSYAYGMAHFTIGSWLTHRIRCEYGGIAYPSGLGTDLAIYGPREDIERERAICFLYQPDKPRRAPHLGIQSLRLVKQLYPEVTIYVYGSDLELNLDFPVVNLGLIDDLSKLNALYNRCTAGLCISGSNPSRIPYEMMVAGCIPIDLYRYNNLMDHSPEAILLAHQDPASIADALMMALGDGRPSRVSAASAMKWASMRSLDWEVDLIVHRLAALLDGDSSLGGDVALTYDVAPIIAEAAQRPSVERFCGYQRELAMRPT